MKRTWPHSPPPAPFCSPQARHPTNEASEEARNSIPHEDAVQTMLSDLPSFGGFTKFDASLPTDAFVKYLPTETYHPQQISNTKTRSLIRALKAKPDKRDFKRDQNRERKRPAPDVPGVTRKRIRWTDLDKERKQACIRVALSAACKYARPGDRVDRLRGVWLENPRRKQMINADVRSALAETVSRWTEKELTVYLERANISAVVTKEGMMRAVRDHLAPEPASAHK